MTPPQFRRRATDAARRSAPILMALTLVGVAWLTVRGADAGAPFPDAVLQAEGVVLAAVVFVLGLNQSAVQRGFDAILGEARNWEARAAAACTAADAPVAATRVWTWASRDAWVLNFKRGASLLDDARDVDEIERYTNDRWAWERLEWAGRLNQLNERLANGKIASHRRRRRLEQEVADLKRRIDRSYERAEELGTLTAGLRRLYGRALMIVARAHRLDRMLRWFTYLLVTGLFVGLVRGGPTLASAADPGVWVAVALPVIAATYRTVVARQLLNEADSLLNELKDSWLVHLHNAERGLGLVCEKLASTLAESGMPHIDKDYAKAVLLELDLAERSAPEVPWLASLRGRLHLAHAVVALRRLERGSDVATENAEHEADLLRELATAQSLLRRASGCASDPVAGLALARCLEFSLADDDVEGRQEAADYACRALDVLERLRPNSWDFGFDRATGVRLAHDWTWGQSFLLRPENSELSARFDLVVDHLTV